MSGGGEEIRGRMERFYRELEEELAPLRRRHAARLRCGPGCAACCVDGLTVFPVEAEMIRRRHAALLERGGPGPAGGCAFLDGRGRCRIYENRPYVCRTQGLPLRWIETGPEGVPVEMRDICRLNEEGPPVESLDADACWTLGPFEGTLAGIQAAADGGESPRVPLRSLFRRNGEERVAPE